MGLWIVSLALQILVLMYFWRRGSAAALRDALRRGISNEFAVRFLFGASLALAAKLAALLPAFADYRIERAMALSTELLRMWALGWLAGTLAAMLLAGLAASIVLKLADATHQWYLYAIAAILAGTFAAALLAPVAGPLWPAASVDASHRAAIAQLESRLGVRHADVRGFASSDATPPAGARLLGLGPTARIVISSALLATATPGEFRFAVARQLAHLRANDPAREALVEALLIIFGTALAVFIADRVGFRRDDDAVSRLAMVGSLLACAYVLATPVRVGFERGLEARADGQAIATTGDRVGAIRAIVRHVDERLVPLCPGFLDRTFLGDRDPAGKRISEMQGRATGCP